MGVNSAALAALLALLLLVVFFAAPTAGADGFHSGAAGGSSCGGATGAGPCPAEQGALPMGPEPVMGAQSLLAVGRRPLAYGEHGEPCFVASAAHDGWTTLGPRPGPPWVDYTCGPPGFCSVLGAEDATPGWAQMPKDYQATTASAISHMMERSA